MAKSSNLLQIAVCHFLCGERGSGGEGANLYELMCWA